MKEKTENIIINALQEINEQLDQEQQFDISNKTVIFGKEGKLDSLGLVNLVVLLEQNIEDVFDVSITLANEKAMSLEQSPFRNVESLANYIDILLSENIDD